MNRFICLALAALLLLAAGCGGRSSSSSLAEGSGEVSSSSQESGESSVASESGADSSDVSASAESSESPDASESPDGEGSAAEEPAGDDVWRLRLVSAAHPLEQELDIELDTVQGYRVDARMAPYLREMINAAAADGISLSVISGYRTFAKSAELYENEVQAWIALGYNREDALTEAAARVAPAGTSEHHTGLAVDIFTSDWKGGFVDAFEDDAGGRWLYNNCARFGFILRFPKDKTEITGIDYEPWHFRFVGVDNAKAIMSRGLCLEEYLNME